MSTADDPLPDLVRGLCHREAGHRARAAKALGRLGGLAQDALPRLVDAVRDDDPAVREAAAQAVGQMGPAARPHLEAMLAHPDKYVRRHATWALGRLGPAAAAAVPALCQALKDGDPRAAAGAAEALGKIGPAAAPAVPALTEAMRGTNIVLCRLAAKALSQVGGPALPALIAHLRHRDPFVRGEAAVAVGWMGAAAAAAVPELIDMLRAVGGRGGNPPADTRTPVTSVLPAAPPGPTADDNSRMYAAQALGRIGPPAAAAVPHLEAAALDRSDQVRQAAAQALRLVLAIPPDPPPA